MKKIRGDMVIKQLCALFLALIASSNYGVVLNSEKSAGVVLIPNQTRVLVKIPTRSRPGKFFKCLDRYYDLLSGKNQVHFLITCDLDDVTMNCKDVRRRLENYPNLKVYFGEGKSKVEAYNRDIDKHMDFDILVVTSDDLIPQVRGYDDIIVNSMRKFFPDTDGVLSFSDGSAGALLNTYPIMGKKYYQRFGYAYHPHYKSLFCDNELTEVSKILNKLRHNSLVLFKHANPYCNIASGEKYECDALYQRNEALDSYDRAVFQYRRASGFNLHPFTRRPVKLSILIPTLKSRNELFHNLENELLRQINAYGLADKVEITVECDNGELPTGVKRNRLLMKSLGEYVCFVDDDDMVSSDYVKVLYDNLRAYPDCLGLTGIITFDGKNPRTFIHSLKYKEIFEKENIYYRPPNHLNPIRRDIAIRFQFPRCYISEDSNWCLQIRNSGLLENEIMIKKPYYFYRYSSKNSVQSSGKK